MTDARRTAAVGLAVAAAFSSMPSAFYHLVSSPWPVAWTTPLLFVVHGVAQIVAMSWVLRRPFPVAPARAVGLLLLADAATGLVLVAAPGTGTRAVLVLAAGRVLSGAALGVLTPAASRAVTAAPGGAAVVTAAVLGGVGAGSLLAGGLAWLGMTRSGVLAVGVAGLLVSGAAAMRTARGVADDGTDDEPDDGTAARGEVAGPRTSAARGTVLAALTLAFAGNGVLALFSSTLPGVVAAMEQGAAVVAGATAGLVMLAAGAARLPLMRLPAARVHVAGAVAAVAGLALFWAGLAGSSPVAALAGGVLLGAACGIGYEASLDLAVRADRTGAALVRVQRAAQLGLVVPVGLWPLASALAHAPRWVAAWLPAVSR